MWLGVLVCLSPDVRVFVWLYAHVRLCMSLCVRAFVSGCAIVCRVSECVLAFVRSCVCVCEFARAYGRCACCVSVLVSVPACFGGCVYLSLCA